MLPKLNLLLSNHSKTHAKAMLFSSVALAISFWSTFMRMNARVFICVLLAVSIASLAAGAQSQPKKISLGILPVFDASGETYGELVTQHMTQMIFDEMQGTSFQPVLLNPGGGYTPLDNDLIKEFGQMSGVNAVL